MLFNKVLIQLFPPGYIVRELLRSELHMLGEPGCRQGRQAADRRSGERGKGGKVCWIHTVRLRAFAVYGEIQWFR